MTDLKSYLNTLTHTIKALEDKWISLGYGAFEILDIEPEEGNLLLEWRRHGPQHRIFYNGKPLLELPVDKRIEACDMIDELESMIDARADYLCDVLNKVSKIVEQKI